MKEQLLKCLKEACPGIDFEKENQLVDNSILDSLSIMTIIAAMMETFEIEIDADDIVADNFNSLDGLFGLLCRKKGE
ncbi:phosphopantetheine-binding protein [[Clostridium] aminophilum]|uniref:phosphopantetheine-binding protein n=1 Tax=[Clostridium] aminophilum TaxID=1526 RepID=UPI003F9E355C